MVIPPVSDQNIPVCKRGFTRGLEMVTETVPHHPDAPSSEPDGDNATSATTTTTTMGIDQSTQTVSRWRCAIHHIASSQINIFPREAHRTSVRSKRTQTKPKMFHPVNKGIQAKRLLKCNNKFTECSLVKGKPLTKLQPSTHTATIQPAAKPATLPEEPVFDDHIAESVSESDYVPSSIDSDDTNPSSDGQEIRYDVLEDSKYIVFGSSLLQLFQKCHKCDTVAKVKITRPNSGTLIEVQQICRKRGCCQIKKWRSQPYIGNIAAGNLLSAAVLTSGCSPKKFLRALTSLNIATISYASFFNHQK
ncbi:uncharacterized protein [Asterias amurensis]|uniref:uncharacterized protein n=1 Tax=Asterias amurensis TaxID=7602 RepID=UPI003AB85BD0